MQELSGSCSKSGFVIWQPFLNIEIKWSKRLRKKFILLPDSLFENFCEVKSKLISGNQRDFTENQCFSKNVTTENLCLSKRSHCHCLKIIIVFVY